MKVEKRTKNAKGLRKEGIVPGVIYGAKIESTSIQVPEKEVLKKYDEFGKGMVFKIDLEGKKHQVYFKDVQTGMINKNRILHFDLIKVTADNTIVNDIKINFIGQEEIEKKRYLLQILEHSFEAEYKVGKGISNYDIDVSEMEIGDSFYIKDLKLSEDIKVLDDPEKMILNVKEQPVVEEVEPDLEEAGLEEDFEEAESEDLEEETKE